MIEQVILRNFRQHAHTELKLSPLTVLVGPNGSGKTSVLEALRLAGQAYTTTYEEWFAASGDVAALVRHAENVSWFQIEVNGSSGGRERGFILLIEKPDELLRDGDGGETDDRFWTDTILLSDRGRGSIMLGLGDLSREGRADHWPMLRDVVLAKPDAKCIATPSPADERAHVGYRGEMTATVLANMKQDHHEAFEAIIDGMRKVVPEFRSIHMRPARVRANTGFSRSSMIP